jgi:hypothetical protein
VSRARGKGLEGMPDAWCSSRRAGRRAEWKYRHGARTKEAIELTKLIRKLGSR